MTGPDSGQGGDLEEHKEAIKEELRESRERLGRWPDSGPFLESLDYVIEDEYACLDAWDELLDEDVIEKFEGAEATKVRLVETDDGQTTLTDGGEPRSSEETDEFQDLRPARPEYENKFWYLMGVGAAALALGLYRQFVGQVQPKMLLVVGTIVVVGGFIWQVVRDE